MLVLTFTKQWKVGLEDELLYLQKTRHTIQTGKEAILKHSAEFLTPQKLLGRPAYALSDPFVADPVKRMVTLGFECLIQGFEGKGTDYLHFDNDNKIYQLVAVRHTGTFDPSKHT